MKEIMDIIQTLGFPIFCVIACGWYIYKTNSESRSDMKERENRQNEQLEKFSVSMDRFNETLTKIDTRLEAVENKIEK